ncbi:PREDICTED: uncharacterized protein LOC108768008 [Trachymyrmex cornetzi]|uniref:uncharacterized protein LOC108768008 n=1 Tax=Trachymyrmex cornetzi TaxID=471704 RepID=UPI00084F1AC9|nr:PREDICTED: uncharacterized protein LOC108768008 [Trachymyrmex cornetzi]
MDQLIKDKVDGKQPSSNVYYGSEEEDEPMSTRVFDPSIQRQKSLKTTKCTKIPDIQKELQKLISKKVVELHVKMDQLLIKMDKLIFKPRVSDLSTLRQKPLKTNQYTDNKISDTESC